MKRATASPSREVLYGFLPPTPRSEMEITASTKPNICNFWKRPLALIIDTLLLALVGLVLGLLLHNHFAAMGSSAILYGLVVSVGYFGILNSRLGGGQTLGKRILGIQVVDADGGFISFGKSAFRALILVLPQMLNGHPIPASALQIPLTVLAGIIVFGGGFSIIYLYLFNRKTRQSLHDLVAGTYVVEKKEPLVDGELEKVFKLHYAVCALFPILLIAGFSVLFFTIGKQYSFEDMLVVQRAVTDEEYVNYCGVQDLTHYSGSSQSTTSFIVTACVKDQGVLDAEHMKRVAHIAMDKYPDAMSRDSLGVVFTYGYDIGICSSWRSRSQILPVSAWLKDE